MRSLRLLFIAALIAIIVPAVVAAQSAAPTARGVSARGVGAPVASLLPVGVRRAAQTPAPVGAPVPFRANTKQNRAMMIVGGAALLTGAVIGGNAGTLISVGGVVVGLWGLYQYLQ